MLQAFQSSEKIKDGIMRNLEEKMGTRTLVSPSKQIKLVSSSVESLMSSMSSQDSPSRATKEKERRASTLASPSDLRAPDKKKRADGRVKVSKARDPIHRILKANHRCFRFQRQMNDLLIKILQRYELDKPILMRDKLDIIWDKGPPRKVPEPEPLLSPAEEFEKVLNEMRAGDEIRVDDSVKGDDRDKQLSKKESDNVNHYAVKFKLGKRKILREKINAKQIGVYRQLLEMIENRKAPNAWRNQRGQLQAY